MGIWRSLRMDSWLFIGLCGGTKKFGLGLHVKKNMQSSLILNGVWNDWYVLDMLRSIVSVLENLYC